MFSSWGHAGSTVQGLEQQVSPDERERMHKDLDEYATKAYPDHGRLEERRHKMQDRFTQADLNEDNVISRDEAEQRLPGLASHFDEIDTDNDGTISRDELQAAEDKMRDEKARKLKEAKEQNEQLARQETDPETVAPPKKKHVKRRPKTPPPEDNKTPPEDSS
jgi:histidinol dehydrogenase